MKKIFLVPGLTLWAILCTYQTGRAQTIVKKGAKYDTIIRKHVTNPPVKKKPKPKVVVTPPPPKDTVKVVVIPTPEFVNQPYYYDKDNNKLIKLENAAAQMITKKKTLGLKGAKQTLTMDNLSSKIRFTSKKDIGFIIKTSGDVIDLTSYIKLYRFVPNDEKREVTINSKEGLLADKDEAKGELISFSVKPISPDNYLIQLSHQLDAGEYGFVWVKNMELKEFTVFAFGIDWKSSD
ncbi:MAG: hypothetical protein JSS80_03780 [Bacteroidetes bacterium]|nr:hypothetical protein [Bacteroidota bacterium]